MSPLNIPSYALLVEHKTATKKTVWWHFLPFFISTDVISVVFVVVVVMVVKFVWNLIVVHFFCCCHVEIRVQKSAQGDQMMMVRCRLSLGKRVHLIESSLFACFSFFLLVSSVYCVLILSFDTLLPKMEFVEFFRFLMWVWWVYLKG